MPKSPEAVVLIHGVWLRGFTLAYLSSYGSRLGYHTYRFSYPSVRGELVSNSQALRQFINNLSEPVVHLVGHSLGGLLIRHLFREGSLDKIGRVVTLGTPHAGSRAGQALRRWPFIGEKLLGRTLSPLESYANDSRNIIHRDLGVLAGAQGWFGIGRCLAQLPKPNDGTVAVAETVTPDMNEHKVLFVGHLSMLLSRKVARAIYRFLATGSFLSRSSGHPHSSRGKLQAQ